MCSGLIGVDSSILGLLRFDCYCAHLKTVGLLLFEFGLGNLSNLLGGLSLDLWVLKILE